MHLHQPLAGGLIQRIMGGPAGRRFESPGYFTGPKL
jgi:hypothetical protein